MLGCKYFGHDWKRSSYDGARLCHYCGEYEFDVFTQSYIQCALWSSLDGDNPMDANYGIEDISAETLERMKEDCRLFQEQSGDSSPNAGHDFWLTRNHHGAGFWDGDWSEPYAKEFTNLSHNFGEFNLYVGDDGKIYH